MVGIGKARKLSGLTQSAAAAIIGKSIPTYRKKEADLRKLTVGEFFNLYQEVGVDSQDALWGCLECLREEYSALKKF